MIYEKSLKTIEFDIIKQMLSDKGVSKNVKEKLLKIEPSYNISDVLRKISETTMAKDIMERCGNPPLPIMEGVLQNLELAEKGVMLTAEQLSAIAAFGAASMRMKKYLAKSETYDNDVSYYGNTVNDITELSEEIERIIRNGMVEDDATPLLKDLNRRIENARGQIKAKLEAMLRKNPSWFSDGFISRRGEHYTLPVKQEYKLKVEGSVVDRSQTGATYFVEPAAVGKLRSELSLLEIDRQNEIIKILYTLTNTVCDYSGLIRANVEAIETLDYIFAKAKLSMDMKGSAPIMSPKRQIKIINGRHPLLNKEEAVPLNFEIGTYLEDGESRRKQHTKGVVVTGPNTGGKTVAIKTIGLLSAMAQSGLHVPADSGSAFCMNNYVLCDIGDGQSITENLSTFSSHITAIIEILKYADKDSLVLLDELGSGTDPAEGMGIAVAVLEELRAAGSLFVATTHYPEIKDYAMKAEGVINARMAFDRESLKPLYRLEIGEAGESCALYIAKKLGFPEYMLKKAYEAAYSANFSKEGESVQPETAPNELFNAEIEDIGEKNKAPRPERKLVTEIPVKKEQKPSKFTIGDSVRVYPSKETGIIYALDNGKGEFGVQVKKKKIFVKHKRLQLIAPASELYPPDYDFSIIFETVEVRKAKKQMTKHHNPDLVIKYE